MKHLIIRNIGPLNEADITLKKVNVIIGPQSSGKSCVLKVACYCTWVEKRIELTQDPSFFEKENAFINELVRFHKLKSYIKADTYIEYESDCMHFSYSRQTGQFKFEWKNRWGYTRSKVTYIPAERNMVAVIPNWFEVKLADDNIRDFMSDWETARKATAQQLEVLNLGVSYHYEESSRADKVRIESGEELDFTDTSSGLQSLIPLYVHLNYLKSLQYEQTKNESVSKNTSRYTGNHFCDIFLEEPEENLFPPTQTQLTDWLLDLTEWPHASNLFIATHSPYILTSLLEKQDIDLGLFFTNPGGMPNVNTATEEDIQEIYDYGVDAFFNLETFSA